MKPPLRIDRAAVASGLFQYPFMIVGPWVMTSPFNRGVTMDTAKWSVPTDYYTSGVYNDYAKFFHSVSVNGLAYGFAYDDIFDQSSVSILPNDDPPSQVTIAVGW